MYHATSSSPPSVADRVNGMHPDPDVDGSGTINPAALSAAAPPLSLNPSALSALAAPHGEHDDDNHHPDTAPAPRGVKRARAEADRDVAAPDGRGGDDLEEAVPEDHAPRKRGRPPKSSKSSAATTTTTTTTTATTAATAARPSSSSAAVEPPPPVTPVAAAQPHTTTINVDHSPPLQAQSQQQQATADGASPGQTSPPSSKAGAKSVVKALPTVRDHTTDQLDDTGDEFIPKERDPGGEAKVDDDGTLQGDRTYKCRTFRIESRGPKLFMLATECARVLGYRDSYLLFNKNRSLHKIIASQPEKDDLIAQDVLPFSYRSRQIAIVTARSMFRQFGSRVIVNGRRVRDDYWESKAKKQGFTEEDLAGEKRPGAAKARDAAAAAAAAAADSAINAGSLPALGHSDVVYTNGPPPVPPSSFEGGGTGGIGAALPTPPPSGLPPGFSPLPSNLAPLPMINPTPSDDPRMREYGSFPRTRQELGGPPYQDRTQPSSAAEILNQASQSAEFNKVLNQQRGYRSKDLDEHWHKLHEPAAPDVDEASGTATATATTATDTGPAPIQSSSSVAGAVDSTPPALHHPPPPAPQQHQGPGSVAAQQAMMQPQQQYHPHQQQSQHQSPHHHQLPHPSQHAVSTPQSSAYSSAAGLQQSQAAIPQSPMRSMGQGLRPEQLHHRGSPGMAVAPSGGSRGYPYGQQPHQQQHHQPQQLWAPPPQHHHPPPPQQQHHHHQQQPQPSPLGMSQFGPQMHPQQQSPSPHPHQGAAAVAAHQPSQSPRHQGRPTPSPQIPGQPSQQPPQQVHQGQAMSQPVGYPGGGTAAAQHPAFSAAAAGMYSPSPAVTGGGGQQFMAGHPPPPPHQPASMGIGMGTNAAALSGWPSTAAGGGLMQPGQPPAGSPPGAWPASY